MPYYSGDYYQGDYYQGDPFWGGLGRLIVRGARAFTGLGRAPAQRVLTSGSAAGAGMASRAATMARAGGTAIVRRVSGAISKHPVLSAAGAAGTIGVIGGAVGRGMGAPAAAGMPSRGFHISMRTGQVVKNRRMRVTNPRALRRAIRRAMGFARLAKRVLRFTSPRAPRGHAVFKFKRRKRV